MSALVGARPARTGAVGVAVVTGTVAASCACCCHPPASCAKRAAVVLHLGARCGARGRRRRAEAARIAAQVVSIRKNLISEVKTEVFSRVATLVREGVCPRSVAVLSVLQG